MFSKLRNQHGAVIDTTPSLALCHARVAQAQTDFTLATTQAQEALDSATDSAMGAYMLTLRASGNSH